MFSVRAPGTISFASEGSSMQLDDWCVCVVRVNGHRALILDHVIDSVKGTVLEEES